MISKKPLESNVFESLFKHFSEAITDESESLQHVYGISIFMKSTLIVVACVLFILYLKGYMEGPLSAKSKVSGCSATALGLYTCTSIKVFEYLPGIS